MTATAVQCSLKDWAALISAVAWPTILADGLLYFRVTLKGLISRITTAKGPGFELSALAESTKTTTEALLPADSDFDKIEDFLDWNKVAAEVRNWAAKHRAQNPSDMGPNNFRRFLFDAGLPGGQALALEWETDGTLKYK